LTRLAALLAARFAEFQQLKGSRTGAANSRGASTAEGAAGGGEDAAAASSGDSHSANGEASSIAEADVEDEGRTAKPGDSKQWEMLAAVAHQYRQGIDIAGAWWQQLMPSTCH
jgi:hypothetical protein